MLDLLKVDLKRALIDKLFIVLCILAGAFAVVTPLLYKGIFMLLQIDSSVMQELEMLGLGFNAKTMFFGSFSLGNNFGFILPMLVAIILCKDFGNGTIRNKIICGKSRASIYLSLLITCIILICAFILAHALSTLMISLLFFEYQSVEFEMADLGYLIGSVGLELLIYVLVSTILTFFIVHLKKAGLSIVMYFVISFVMMIFGSITQTVIMLADPNTTIYKVLEFFNTSNAFTTTAIGNGFGYELKDLLFILLPNAAFAALFAVLGFLSFQKKDIK